MSDLISQIQEKVNTLGAIMTNATGIMKETMPIGSMDKVMNDLMKRRGKAKALREMGNLSKKHSEGKKDEEIEDEEELAKKIIKQKMKTTIDERINSNSIIQLLDREFGDPTYIGLTKEQEEKIEKNVVDFSVHFGVTFCEIADLIDHLPIDSDLSSKVYWEKLKEHIDQDTDANDEIFQKLLNDVNRARRFLLLLQQQDNLMTHKILDLQKYMNANFMDGALHKFVYHCQNVKKK
ncbi:hypothetical protein SNEBB_002649 [Seison nebaliae]|nr:hypothetical protein SNEBB_002649 [Seison nebaliae]